MTTSISKRGPRSRANVGAGAARKRAPEVTVVIVTHDRPALLQRAVASALGQSFRDLEVVVVDNASREPALISAKDDRLRLIRRNGPGSQVTAARKVGEEAARGRWITFLDDDDELLPDMLESSLRAAQATQLPRPVAVLSGVEVVGDDGGVEATYLPKAASRGKHYFLEGLCVSREVANTLVVPLDVFRDVGGWDPEVPGREHFELFLRLNAGCSIEAVPLAAYRKYGHGGVRARENLLATAAGMERTLAKHRTTFAGHRRFRAHFLGALGITYLRAGRWRPAVAATSRAVVADPLRPKLLMWWVASLAGPRPLPALRRARAGIRRITRRRSATGR